MIATTVDNEFGNVRLDDSPSSQQIQNLIQSLLPSIFTKVVGSDTSVVGYVTSSLCGL